MTLAFKEWAYIVDALGRGKQSIIIRKGGIEEEGGDFNIKGKRFLLFPTQFHQAREMIKPEWLKLIDGEQYQFSHDKVKIEFFAEIVDSRIIEDYKILEKLDSQHAWKKEIISERFNRWNKSVHLLILQVFKLNKSIELDVLPQYGGCRSWIQIENISNFDGVPVIYEPLKGTFWT